MTEANQEGFRPGFYSVMVAIVAVVGLVIGACALSDHYAKPQVITGIVTSKVVSGTNQNTSLQLLLQNSRQCVAVTREQFDQVKAGQLVLASCLVGFMGDPMKCQFVRGLDDQRSGS